MRFVTSSQMKRLDSLAQKQYGIPSLILMENAGRLAAEEILKRFKKGKAAIFCGKGNNGGDGFVVARCLSEHGIKTDVFLLSKPHEIKNRDPLTNCNILRRLGVKLTVLNSLKVSAKYDFFVDALFGIGFKGSLPSFIEKLVSVLNKTKKPIFSLDVPTGMDATTGRIGNSCIKAYKTITFGLPKMGFKKQQAKKFLGKLIVKDIGIPKKLTK